MILYRTEQLPDGIEKRIIEDSKKSFNSITAYTLVNGVVDGFFYKKINMPKVKERYDGDYVQLLIEYYEKLKKLVECNKMVELFSEDDSVYEISHLLDNKKILCDNNNVTFSEIKNIFYKALEGIQKMEYNGDRTLGIDSAIWNYTKEGLFFDYDPPKILRGESLFITPDEDYRKRVLYRNFNYNGMRANTLGTIILGHNNWNFNITNLPPNYVEELISIFLESLKEEDKEKYIKEIYGEKDVKTFQKHPINIIRKELRK